MTNTAKNINILSKFCGVRDVDFLTKECLKEKFGFEQADAAVLFGGSIMFGGDVFAQAMMYNVARTFVIVGGEGHTTETLRATVHKHFPQIQTDKKPEAAVFAEYLKHKYNLSPDYTECLSTNCGNNITNLLELFRQNGIKSDSVILIQDASMQRRMSAGIKKYRPDITAINYAAYSVTVSQSGENLSYNESISGMWDIERYITLLMGEIPRLSDNADGYGPEGKGYIAHVDIPDEVLKAFDALKEKYKTRA